MFLGPCTEGFVGLVLMGSIVGPGGLTSLRQPRHRKANLTCSFSSAVPSSQSSDVNTHCGVTTETKKAIKVVVVVGVGKETE